MNAFEVYEMYVALKNHFTQKSYSYFKYNGKTRVTVAQFEKRPDKYFFEKLSKHYDPRGFLLSNILNSTSFWIGEFSQNEQATKNYHAWKKRVDSLKYLYTDQIKKLFDRMPISRWFKIENSEHPYLMVLYLRGELSPETFIILTDVIGCYSYWNKELKGDIVWEEVSVLYTKYRPFLNYDRAEYKEILKSEMKKIVVETT